MPDAAGPQHANTEHPHPNCGGTAQARDQPPMCSFRYPCLVIFGAVSSQAIQHARSRLRQARRSQRQRWDPQPFAPEIAQLTPVSGGMEDLDATVALGGLAPPADSGASGADVELAWAAHGAGASEREGEVLGERVALQAVAAPRPRRYEQRSWELMAQARAERALKKARSEATAASSNADNMAATLSVVARQFPVVARTFGLQALEKRITNLTKSSAGAKKRDATRPQGGR